MTQYNSLNLELSNSQFNKLKSGIKNGTEVTLNLSSNVIGHSDNETNFQHKLLLTDRQLSKLCQAFLNNWSANIKLLKTQLTKIPSLPHIVPGVLSGEVTSETIAIDLIKNNKDLPKSQKDITIFLKSRT